MIINKNTSEFFPPNRNGELEEKDFFKGNVIEAIDTFLYRIIRVMPTELEIEPEGPKY